MSFMAASSLVSFNLVPLHCCLGHSLGILSTEHFLLIAQFAFWRSGVISM